jgi:DNA invertase Pin-like site-specific DNA recombinase
MPKPINYERTKAVVMLRENKKMPWRKIGKAFNLAASTVFEIYKLEKERSGLTKIRKTGTV